MSINLFIASGRLGRDMEVRTTQNGKQIGSFSLPVESGWGENKKTSWVNCKMFGDRAGKLAPYLTKGSLVTVQGKFVMEEWEKDGVKNQMACIMIDDVQLPAKQDGGNQQQSWGQPNQPQQQAAPQQPQYQPQQPAPQQPNQYAQASGGYHQTQQQPQPQNFDDSDIPF